MNNTRIKYVIVDKEGKEFRPIEHSTTVIPRKDDKFKDLAGTFIVEDVIHEGIFSPNECHEVTIILKEI